MDTKQASATELKQGKYVIFDGKCCVVRSMQISKPGKHGHAKCRVEAICLTDDSKIIKVMPGHERVEIPLVEKKKAQVLSIAGNKATVMDSETFETFELLIPDEMKEKVKEGKEVSYWVMIGQKVMRE